MAPKEAAAAKDKATAAKEEAPRTRLPGKTGAVKAAAKSLAAPAEPKVNDEARPVAVEPVERNALLTALRAQSSAKKATPEHREEAARLLDQYKHSDAKGKTELLLSLREKGVKNLAWSHQFQEQVTHDTTTETAATAGMFTRSKIFQIQGLVERDLTDQEAAGTLEDLLTEAETLYGYERQHVPHKTNRRLDRWYYRWAQGETEREIYGLSFAV